nr:sigma-70 family RNA polymerase sigma factor [Kribbella sandramycini]
MVEQAQGGDVDAFAQLYDQHVTTIFRYAYGKTSSRALAEDLTSETFVRAFRSITRRPERSLDFIAWLITIARNVVIDHHRSAWSRLAVVTDDFDPQVDQAAGPEEAAIGILGAEALRAALDRLPADQRECLLLRFYAGLSITETAQAMERTEGAIKQLQWRATNKLRGQSAAHAAFTDEPPEPRSAAR